MPLVLDQDQRQIQESARRFFSEQSPVTAFRALRDNGRPQTYSTEIWQQIHELGFTAAAIPDSLGGLGLGYVALGSVLEEAGRVLCASPLFATVVLGASAIELAGTDAQRSELLGSVCAGKLRLSLALDESAHHDPAVINTTAAATADGYVLNGQKRFVIDGGSADKLIVIARDAAWPAPSAPLLWFVLDRTAPGLTITPLQMTDSRDIADLRFDDVTLSPAARLPHADERGFAQLLDRARACLAAEMLGGITELFERTMAYLREREQFGVKIGSFQGLKHRAARLYAEIELTRSCVIAALSALDHQAADTSLLCCLAKARANDTYRLVSNEAIQMHGGIGVTDELDVGLFLKRSRTSMQHFGDSILLRKRYAELSAF